MGILFCVQDLPSLTVSCHSCRNGKNILLQTAAWSHLPYYFQNRDNNSSLLWKVPGSRLFPCNYIPYVPNLKF